MSEPVNFQPDGWGSRARIGLITPHNDIVPEAEFQTLAPKDISIHAARVPLGWRSGPEAGLIGFFAVRGFAEPPNVDDAAEMETRRDQGYRRPRHTLDLLYELNGPGGELVKSPRAPVLSVDVVDECELRARIRRIRDIGH